MKWENFKAERKLNAVQPKEEAIELKYWRKLNESRNEDNEEKNKKGIGSEEAEGVWKLMRIYWREAKWSEGGYEAQKRRSNQFEPGWNTKKESEGREMKMKKIEGEIGRRNI